MSKKTKLYLLLLINLIAWGYVGYKVYYALQGDDDVAFNYDKPIVSKIIDNTTKEPEKLNLNYADPFLKAEVVFNEKKQILPNRSYNNKGSINDKLKQDANQTLPNQVADIKYLGLIKSSEKSKITAMISVNGKSYFVKTSDVVEGYTVKQITNSTIILSKGNNKVVITK